MYICTTTASRWIQTWVMSKHCGFTTMHLAAATKRKKMDFRKEAQLNIRILNGIAEHLLVNILHSTAWLFAASVSNDWSHEFTNTRSLSMRVIAPFPVESIGQSSGIWKSANDGKICRGDGENWRGTPGHFAARTIGCGNV